MMEKPIQGNKGKRDPRDDMQRRKVWLQIYLPVLIGIVAITILSVTIWVTGQGTASVWADVSLMMLIIPTFIIGILLLVVVAAMVYAITYLIGVLPDPFREVQRVMQRVSVSSDRISKVAVRPIIVPRAIAAAIRTFFKGIISIFNVDRQ